MIDSEELGKKPPDEMWATLADKYACPGTLQPFVYSRLLTCEKPEDDPRTTALLVELRPGFSIANVAHMTESLASFFDMPPKSVTIEANAAKARRVEITLVEEDA